MHKRQAGRGLGAWLEGSQDPTNAWIPQFQKDPMPGPSVFSLPSPELPTLPN